MGTNKYFDDDVVPWISIAIACLCCILLLHFALDGKGDAECTYQHVNNIKYELCDHPEVKPFVMECFADGKITNSEYNQIMERFQENEIDRSNRQLAKKLLE